MELGEGRGGGRNGMGDIQLRRSLPVALAIGARAARRFRARVVLVLVVRARGLLGGRLFVGGWRTCRRRWSDRGGCL